MKSNLDLAIESRMPETVWLVLDKGLASREDTEASWAKLTSPSGRQSFLKTSESEKPGDRLEEIINLLVTFGKFDKLTASDNVRGDTPRTNDVPLSSSNSVEQDDEPMPPVPAVNGRQPRPAKYNRKREPPIESESSASPSEYAPPQSPQSDSYPQTQRTPHSNNRARGRGGGRRGGWRGRGGIRGRGRGGGSVPAAEA